MCSDASCRLRAITPIGRSRRRRLLTHADTSAHLPRSARSAMLGMSTASDFYR
jgi:hypothetical protein